MNDLLPLLISFPTGLLLGTIFYGGLWYTVQKGMSSKTPSLWFVLSFFIRIGTAVGGFYFISSGHWERLMVCFIGFMIARIVVTKVTKSLTKGVAHEN